MANRLKMARVQSILSLHAQGWSRRRISRELDIDRETVSRYVQLDQQSAAKRELDPGAISKPANAPIPGPGSSALVEPPIPPIESPGSGRRSDCEPWREVIAAKRDQGLSARRIYQDLASEHSAPVSYDSVRRFMRRLGWARPLPFRRLECAPGQECRSISARERRLLAGTASVVARMCFASCCLTRARPTAKQRIGRPRKTSSARWRMPSIILAE